MMGTPRCRLGDCGRRLGRRYTGRPWHCQVLGFRGRGRLSVISSLLTSTIMHTSKYSNGYLREDELGMVSYGFVEKKLSCSQIHCNCQYGVCD